MDEENVRHDGHREPEAVLNPSREKQALAQRIPSDHAVRVQALDPAQSFLIQAPAGSGKTELLTDRILALLATVDKPEEIVAITFTRKAAAEMHARVLAKLRAGLAPPPQEAFRLRSWELARAAMRRDAAQDWQLLQHPTRLSIRTIDAYCAHLVRAMPWLSALGGMPTITDDAQSHYQAAARATLAMMDDTPVVADLIAHLDVNLRDAETLIATMLGSRDQWLPLLQQGGQVQTLIDHLQTAVQRDLSAVAQAMPMGWAHALHQPLRQAAQVLSQQVESAQQTGQTPAPHALGALLDWDGEPFAPTVQNLPRWHALAHALLTQDNALRKRVDKSLGFPPKSAHKDAFVQCLAALDPDASWLALLAQVRSLPAGYDDDQLATLRMLLAVLRLAAAQLLLRFSETAQVDFIEIAQRADAALGHVEDPSDLLLKLDARVRHILVDEFQDTSQSQIALLLKLTAGWQPGDGRTLFLVGDPMQSIYRFRKAEVGWFLRVKAQGLGELPLTALHLTNNFRSRAGVVDWVNRVFAPLFPQQDDTLLGAIRYTPSHAFQPADAGQAVQWHPVWEMEADRDDGPSRDDTGDADAPAAQHVALALVREALARNPASSHPVAILVRARAHLDGMVRRLEQEGIPCRAVDLEPLHARQVVSDLAQLTRALSHPADRLAWLSVLRSPLCGLRLDSLYAIAGEDHDSTIPYLLQRWLRDSANARTLFTPDATFHIAADEAQRLRHAAAVLLDTRNDAGVIPFAAWVAQCWQRLGGDLVYSRVQDRADVEQVLRLIEQLAPFGNLDLARFEDGLQTLYAASGAAPRAVEVMTIHKSKGLEFDTVILMGLHHRPQGDRPQLVHFEQTEGEFLLGPIAHRVSDAPDPVSAYLAAREKKRSRFEHERVLYVGATRARETLHLIGAVRVDAGGQIRPPAPDSLLGRLWPYLPERSAPAQAPQAAAANVPEPAPRWIARLPLAALHCTAPSPAPAAPPTWRWQPDSLLERLTGTVAHAWLERLGGARQEWDAARVAQQADVVRRQLSRAGLPVAHLDEGVRVVLDTLTQTVNSPRGRWLLGLSHVRREWELLDAQGRVSIIDLAVQDAQGWLVVDYKTSVPHPRESLEDFAERMRARHAEQLARYCAQVTALDGRPARGALYFPRVDVWVE